MNVLVDDIGSFPLPPNTTKNLFAKAYVSARNAIINGNNIKEDIFLKNNFYQVIIDSFKKKLETGLDTVNYPQHYNMNKQFLDIIHKTMNKGTYTINKKDAIIPEIYVIKQEAKKLHETTGTKIPLRVCITGPLELYLKEIGTTPYKDVLLMFAETVKRFAKQSILNTKYIETKQVAIDEPSFGIQDINADTDTITNTLEKAFDFNCPTKHIHIHSPSRIPDILNIRNLDTISIEHAAHPQNTKNITKQMLQKTDKRIRIGITRTDIDAITSELHDKGITNPTPEQLVENQKIIKKRYTTAKKKYKETMTFAGPDCGLSSWPTQKTALILLKRTVNTVKTTKTDP
jgi:5-methyltetrahydropteroyltriglutamate--homocysteine methyltransferase